ncbi:5,6-dimethylbenzimidazole synthase [Sulfurimonas sp. HSL3-2]|uniref:5,6-dimethylbenzimidazole synthase n=1 Tax=Hydrocurvibacter mobilis TaxID=3131936 RepID=UPI0031F8A66F
MNFTKKQSQTLNNIIVARRDVRGNNFLSKKIKKKQIDKILSAGIHAPSVGFSQPWKFVVIKNEKVKNKIYKNFQDSYEKSKKHFQDRELYNSLKLEGIKETPINIAVFYKKPYKKILGQTSSKKMGEYSVVCAIENMWLMARSLNIGIGWVSIIDHKKVQKTLGVDNGYKLVGYLCVGYVKEFLELPELESLKWEEKKTLKEVVSWV